MRCLKKLIKKLPPIREICDTRDYYAAECERLNSIINLDIRGCYEKLMQENRDQRNLIDTLFRAITYNNKTQYCGEYERQVTITTVIGCPVKCRYCPQKQFLYAYKNRANPVGNLTFDKFKQYLEAVPKNVIISFDGASEPFVNPECINMLMYSIEKGYKVRTYTTIGDYLTIDDYKKFKDSPNFHIMGVHIPDSHGNTVFPITASYLKTLQYIVENKPKHAAFNYACLGAGATEHPLLSHIVSCVGYGADSCHGLNYDNYVNHYDYRLSCSSDCGRLDVLNGGICLLLPNGDVVGCCKDWELKHVIGNINETPNLDSIMNSEKRKEFIRGLTDPSTMTICRNCELAFPVWN